MYDVIKSNAYVDAARVFHSLFEASYDWNWTPVGKFRNAINTGSGTWASDIDGIKTNINQMLKNISSSVR